MRGLDPLLTQASLEDGRKRREEESKRARARTKILDQVRGVVQATFKDPITPNRRERAESEEGQWSQKRGSSEAGSEDGEKEEQDKRRVQSSPVQSRSTQNGLFSCPAPPFPRNRCQPHCSPSSGSIATPQSLPLPSSWE